MDISEEINDIKTCLESLVEDYKHFFNGIRLLQGQDVDKAFLAQNSRYMTNKSSRFEKVKTIYSEFTQQINDVCNKYFSQLFAINQEEISETYELLVNFDNMKKELTNNCELLERNQLEKNPSFMYQDFNISNGLTVDLASRYPGSYFYKEYASNKRTKEGNIFIDSDSTNDEYIVKYMKNDESLQDDIEQLDAETKLQILKDLSFFELPVKYDAICQLCYDDDNQVMNAWRRRMVVVNGQIDFAFNELLKEYELFDSLFENTYLQDILYDADLDIFCIEMHFEYLDVIYDYLKNKQTLNKKLIRSYDENGNPEDLINEMESLGIQLDENQKKTIRSCFDVRFLRGSSILNDTAYDSYLREWIGDYRMKLIFRASQNIYMPKLFYLKCDNVKGPTLVLIKSVDGWIFGGYTERSWSGKSVPLDNPKSFIFTLKNPHYISPTRYMERKESNCAINCNPDYGPGFGSDIVITSDCNTANSCSIQNDGTKSYMCDPTYKSSLFVNSDRPDKENLFAVKDYEVYCINYENLNYVYNTCTYPDVIKEYIQTRDISDLSLQSVSDEKKLIHDLDLIHCNHIGIQLKISKFFLKKPSDFLTDTQIVDAKYDPYLKVWLGEHTVKLLYRASDHGYSAKAFHQLCDDKGPTLVVFKSTRGWIFGGYTTKSWSHTSMESSCFEKSVGKYKDDPDAFIFTLKNPHNTSPAQFMKRKEANQAIGCKNRDGPVFGGSQGQDIFIGSDCSVENSCHTQNDGNQSYCCDVSYKCSLFVGTNTPDKSNTFEILDYEVYAFEDYKNRIYSICKYPDIIWSLLQSSTAPEQLMNQFANDAALLHDLDLINCTDNNVKLAVSSYFLSNPSLYLPDSQIVEERCDTILREWLGGKQKWKLIYRASEHEYTSESFHKCCDNKGATVVIIKSTKGWIFGGYTTQSWGGKNVYRNDKVSFIFTLRNPFGTQPMRFLKREESTAVIYCDPTSGPIFGNQNGNDIWIGSNCNKKNSCGIWTDGTKGFECDPLLKRSLFVNSGKANDKNSFAVLDYEVFCVSSSFFSF